jgi:hypothetical protein
MDSKSRAVKPAVIGIEDQKAKGDAIIILEAISARLGANAKPINPEAGRLIQAMMLKQKNGSFASATEIEAVIKAQGDDEHADTLRRFLQLPEQLVKQGQIRDQKMAENVFAAQGNYAIVVGKAHAEDLAKKLHELCLQPPSL